MVKKATKEEFVKKAREVHGDKYTYDEFEYVNAIAKSNIICPKHGTFSQSANTHLRGHGCPKCSKESVSKVGKLTFEVFEQRAQAKHSEKYTYIPTELVNNRTKVKIICPIHGEFEQRASLHLIGQGCPQCSREAKRIKMAKTTEQFIEEAKKAHGDK